MTINPDYQNSVDEQCGLFPQKSRLSLRFFVQSGLFCQKTRLSEFFGDNLDSIHTIITITPTTYAPTIPTIVTTDHRGSIFDSLDYFAKNEGGNSVHIIKTPLCVPQSRFKPAYQFF